MEQFVSYSPKILIVHDDPMVCDSLGGILRMGGYDAQVVGNCSEALRRLSEGRFDLVLLDIATTDVGARKILDHIAAGDSGALVVVIADNASLHSADESLKKEAFDYLKKPFEPEDLLRTVHNAIRQKRLENDRLLVREALEAQNRELILIFDSIDEPIYVSDPETYEMLYANAATKALFGRNILGKKCHRVLQSSDQPCDFCTNPKIFGKNIGKSYAWEHQNRINGRWYRCIDKAIRWPDGKMVRYQLGVDIHERKLAEEALRESEEKYSKLVENSLTGIYIDQDGKIVFANNRFAEIYNYPRKELIGIESWRLVHPDDRELTDNIRSKRLKGVEAPSEYDAKGFTKDGRTIWIRRMNTRIEYGGRPAVLGNIVDITGEKTVEEEMQKLAARVKQAHKMEAIGTLAGGIAHDFNNLLMGIQGNASLMLMDLDPTHPHYERLKNIEQQIQSGARLTSHLLGYARKGRYEIKSIDLNKLLRETSEAFGRTRREITIHLELAEDLYSVDADAGQIEQVLLNLFVNASDAMPGGGRLLLKTANTGHEHMTGKLYEPKPGRYASIIVTDTGVGMDTNIQERIFDPFFTTKEMGRGTGLGLASAYGIVKGHGGYIDVESKKGEGSTFIIYLPKSEKKIKKAARTREPLARGAGTVLLVDDEKVVLEVGRELLESMGYRVLLARDGQEAIEVFKENLEGIDMVLLDMVMPNVGGGKAYDLMRRLKPDVKVLLSSGFSIEGEASEILARGCDGFIQKPFTIKQLSGKIREVLKKR